MKAKRTKYNKKSLLKKVAREFAHAGFRVEIDYEKEVSYTNNFLPEYAFL